MRLTKTLIIGWLLGGFACTSEPAQYTSETAPFSAPQDCGEVSDDLLDEVSGLVASRKNPSALWVHNDSGHPSELYLISAQGQLLATYWLADAENVDWEDMAIGPGPEEGETYLYVGDIGDNVAMYDERYVHRFIEPVYHPASAAVIDTITHYDRLGFFYREGSVDAETLLLDPTTQDLFVLTKEMSEIRVYQFRYPPTPPFRQPAELVATLPFDGANLLDRLVGGDISPDGKEVLLKTYGHVLYWHRADTTISLPALLQLPADTLPYVVEPQGEAIGFAADGSGYYTLSERNFGMDLHLYFYPRNKTDSTASPTVKTVLRIVESLSVMWSQKTILFRRFTVRSQINPIPLTWFGQFQYQSTTLICLSFNFFRV